MRTNYFSKVRRSFLYRSRLETELVKMERGSFAYFAVASLYPELFGMLYHTTDECVQGLMTTSHAITCYFGTWTSNSVQLKIFHHRIASCVKLIVKFFQMVTSLIPSSSRSSGLLVAYLWSSISLTFRILSNSFKLFEFLFRHLPKSSKCFWILSNSSEFIQLHSNSFNCIRILANFLQFIRILHSFEFFRLFCSNSFELFRIIFELFRIVSNLLSCFRTISNDFRILLN